MRPLWFVARTEIAHQLRRRETLMWVFVMPVIFFYFIGTVSGGMSIEPGSRHDRLALRAPADGGFLVDEIVRRLEAQQFVVERPATDEAFERYTRRLTIPAPPDGKTFTAAALAGEPQTLDYRSRAEGPGADYERIRIGRAVYSLLADIIVAGQGETTPDAAAVRAVATAPQPVRLEVASAGRRLEPPSGYAQTIPGTMVMFTMLVLLTGGAISLVVEREQGLLRRLASTPITRGTVVAGKWVGKLLLGLVQIGFAMHRRHRALPHGLGRVRADGARRAVRLGGVLRVARVPAGQPGAHPRADGRRRRAHDAGAGGARRLLVAHRDHALVDAAPRARPADRLDHGRPAQVDQLRRRTVVGPAAPRGHPGRRCRARRGEREDVQVSIGDGARGRAAPPWYDVSVYLLYQLLDLYSLIVFVAVIASWMQLSPYNPIGRVVYGLTEPLLLPIRRVLPPVGGLDFSPLVLLLLVQLVKRMLFF